MLNEEIARIFEEWHGFWRSKAKTASGSWLMKEPRYPFGIGGGSGFDRRAGKLKETPGIGKDLSAMIDEYVRMRRIKRYEQECMGIPASLI
jgi:hypothetical protein